MLEHQKSVFRVRETSADDLRRLAASGHLFAIVDSCRVPFAPKKAAEIGEERAISLYRETTDQGFWDVAPYLFIVDLEVLDWVSEIGATEGWGVFIVSKANIGALRHHFRHFLKVQAPAGEIWYFRFYDPRVLKPFISACTSQELAIFFGSVAAYGIREPQAESALFFQEVAAKPTVPPSQSLMFRIKESHLAALEPVAEASFLTRLVDYVRREFPAVVEELPAGTLSGRVRIGVERARSFGIEEYQNIALFVALMFEFAPNFDQHPHINQLLLDPAILPEKRMSAVVDEISDEEWDQVEASRDGQSWN